MPLGIGPEELVVLTLLLIALYVYKRNKTNAALQDKR